MKWDLCMQSRFHLSESKKPLQLNKVINFMNLEELNNIINGDKVGFAKHLYSKSFDYSRHV